MTYILKIYNFNNPREMIEINKNNMYILNSVGLREIDQKDEDEEDSVETDLKRCVFLKFQLNINETLILRTSKKNEVLIYCLYEKKLFFIRCRETIINVKVYSDKYVTFFFKDKMIEILNLDNFNSLVVKTQSFNPEALFAIYVPIVEEKIKLNIKNTLEENEPFLLERFTSNQKDFEKLISFFFLTKEVSKCFLKINDFDTRFIYDINLNEDFKLKEVDFLELIDFLDKHFYDIVKVCTFRLK